MERTQNAKAFAARQLKRAALLAIAAASALRAQSTQPALTAPQVDLTKGRTLYAVGYAHLDTQWRWTYPQVIREFVANTMRNNFPLFEKYPHYVFNWTGSRRYEMMKEYFPEDYAKVKQYVAEGRWWPAGSSADENDVNMPSGESIIRQVLYGNHFFRSEFGVASNEYMLPDCFGFPYALPSLLAHCGLKGFNTQKLTWNSAAGIPFNFGVWLGPDNKGVLAALNPGGYGTQIKTDLTQDQKWVTRIDEDGQKSGLFADFMYYGTGDRGGSPTEESVKNIEKAATETGGPVRVISSATSWLFDAVSPQQAEKLPHYQGELELTMHSAGSPSSQAAMKRWNRKNELLADGAERASVAAMTLTGAAYPQGGLNAAWDLVLGSQMHDMMAGTAMPKAYEYCWNDELIAANRFSSAEQDAISTLAGQMDTTAKGVAVVVYNPLSIEREDTVEATVHFADSAPQGVAVFDHDGKALPTQVLSREDHSIRLLFVATVPAVGAASFDVRSAEGAAPASTLKVTADSLENERYAVTVDANGDVASIIDKQADNKQLLSGPMRLGFMYTRPVEYPAWNLDWADMQKPPFAYVDGPAEIKITENGPVRVALSITRHAQGSTFTQTVRLSTGSTGDRVEFLDSIDWQTKTSLLKQIFPLTVSNPKATYDIQVGAIERGNDDPKKYEVIQHQWFDLTNTDGKYGVSVLNDSKFGSDKPDDNTLRLSLLHSPGVRDNYQDQATQDWGHHDILYALAGHAGDWRGSGGAEDTFWQGQRLNQPLRVFAVASHEGSLGRSFSLLNVDNPHVAVAALKKAEDGDAVIVRLREITGSKQAVKLSASTGIASATEVDGQERPAGAATVEDGKLSTSVDGYSLRAFALKLSPSNLPAKAVQQTAVNLPFDTDAVSASSNLKDGGMDGAGRTYPAENFPKTIACGAINFTLGDTADGAKNAVACHGQTITLPGSGRVFIVAAANDGDADATFDIGGKRTQLTVQDWGGYIGSWDNRRWGGDVPELTYEWHNPLEGLTPGFVKPQRVAWFCSHRHNPTDGNEYYNYSYLFSSELNAPSGSDRTLKLPDNPRIKIFAITVADGLAATAEPLAPLFDNLKDHSTLAADLTPVVSAPAGSVKDTVAVHIVPPLYWQKGTIHYTTDGSEPTASSPTAGEAPIYVSQKSTISARAIEAGRSGPTAKVEVDVTDSTPPSVKDPAMLIGAVARVHFSEPVDPATAEKVDAYRVDNGVGIKSVKLTADGTEALLSLASTPDSSAHTVHIAGVSDRSPAHNVAADLSVPLQVVQPVVTVASFTADGKNDYSELGSLPAKSRDKWTMNCFVKAEQMPPDHSVIAGFGRAAAPSGGGRFFTKTADGLEFSSGGSWRSGISPKVPFQVGQWQMLTATCDGDMIHFYVGAAEVGYSDNNLADGESVVRIGPAGPGKNSGRFVGEVRNLQIWDDVLSPESITSLMAGKPTN